MVRSRSYIATPPGATIKELLNDRGMSQKEFAARMDMSEKHISKLINGDVQLTPETAVRLEMVLGVPAKFWNNLEAIYREKIIKAEAENAMDADAEIANNFLIARWQNSVGFRRPEMLRRRLSILGNTSRLLNFHFLEMSRSQELRADDWRLQKKVIWL